MILVLFVVGVSDEIRALLVVMRGLDPRIHADAKLRRADELWNAASRLHGLPA
jgi:hypothetical protein